MTAPLDQAATTRTVDELWDSAQPVLEEYIRIPNKSPQFDRAWREHGHMDRAVELVERWAREHAPRNAQIEVSRIGERTPVLVIEVPGTLPGTIVLYGHLDKQPEMSGWEAGLGAWTPVVRGDRLYGRGSADDGYAVFAAIIALRALEAQNIPHARCIILIETCEESGSVDLPAYIDHLAPRLGAPDLVICLDSGCATYDQVWTTTSLRGVMTGTLRIRVLTEGIHSGDASGVVPSSFRIARMLLDRIEDATTGRIRLEALHAPIPADRIAQARDVAAGLGDELWKRFPWFGEMRPMVDDPVEIILNRTWRPFLAVTGASGLPDIPDAGNVLRPETALKISIRLPPTIDHKQAIAHLKQVLETDPPFGATVSYERYEGGTGWNAAPFAPWLEASLDRASRTYFGKPSMAMGEGVSIPFMAMLGKRYPDAQFLITGVLGPGSNAHGPNEFLHLPTARRLTACVASVIRDHGDHAEARATTAA